MLKKLSSNLKKGFTLVETLIVVGVFSLFSIGVYATYKTKYENSLISKQAEYLAQIVDGINLNLMTADTNVIGVLGINNRITAQRLITQEVIPNEMILTPTLAKTLWGGNILFAAFFEDITNDAVNNFVPVFGINLFDIPMSACTKLASHPLLVEKVQSITINGNLVKQGGTNIIDSGATAAACALPLNNILISGATVKPGIAPVVTTTTAGSLRAKETKYYIATAGTNAITVGPTACAAGTVWSAVTSSCNCPATSEWNGTRCVPYNSNAVGDAGFCPLGQRWNMQSAQCENIPGGIVGVYQAGRLVPGTITTPAQITSSMITFASCATPTTKPAAAPIASNPAGNFDGRVCNKCTVGTWNGDRCVAP